MPNIHYIGRNLKTYNISEHFHEYWELIYCTNGDGIITCHDGTVIRYESNQLVLVPPYIRHTNSSVKGFMNIHMTVTNWTPFYDKALVVTDNTKKDLYSIITQLLRYNNSESHNKNNIIQSYTELLLNLIIGFVGKSKTSSCVDLIENSILDNYQDCNCSISNILDSIPMSNDYLRKLFIKEKGISPLTFLNQTRISFAEKLIVNNNINHYKMNEIAEMCGFADPLYFSRVFKKVMNVSPTHLANKINKTNQ